MLDVARRVRGRVQLTTDAHKPYLQAVEDAFGVDVDFATLLLYRGGQRVFDLRTNSAKVVA